MPSKITLVDDEETSELMESDMPRELDFDEDRARPPRRDRTGGPNASPQASANGVFNGSEITDDDMSPETLLDDGGLSVGAAGAADVDLAEVSLDEVGAGGGLDEAELADLDPVGGQASQELYTQIARHAADLNAVERSEAAMQSELRDTTKLHDNH